MTPDARLAFARLKARGRWNGRDLSEEVTLFIEAEEVVVRLESGGEELACPLSRLIGVSVGGESLVLHVGADQLELRGESSLDPAGAALAERACVLPEVARGLRALGSERGGEQGWQAQFFGPLLRARRLLQERQSLDWQVARFDAPALAEQLRLALAAIASERHRARPPFQRALDAELTDAAEPVFRRLRAVDEAARVVHASEDRERFASWRSWAAQLRALFVDADRCCVEIVSILGRPHFAASGKAP
ncbi:MAG: hypothetical protein ABIZ91_08070 [Gemmatimonadaceae bacterium]